MILLMVYDRSIEYNIERNYNRIREYPSECKIHQPRVHEIFSQSSEQDNYGTIMVFIVLSRKR